MRTLVPSSAALAQSSWSLLLMALETGPFLGRIGSKTSYHICFYTLFAIQRQSFSMACGDHHGHPHPFCYAETIMVIHFFCFRDYFSLFFHPEIIKSDGMRRPSWSSVFIVFKTISVSFASIDNQV